MPDARDARRGRRLGVASIAFFVSAIISIILEGWNMDAPALEPLPVAVIGGGPVGLAAAAHLIARGLPVKVYEAGPAVGSNLRDWGHVRVFTPWRYCVDAGRDRAPQSSRLAVARGRQLFRPGPSWSAPISNRLRQRPSWRPSSKPMPASPRSRARASIRSSAAGARRGLSSWP